MKLEVKYTDGNWEEFDCDRYKYTGADLHVYKNDRLVVSIHAGYVESYAVTLNEVSAEASKVLEIAEENETKQVQEAMGRLIDNLGDSINKALDEKIANSTGEKREQWIALREENN